MTNGTRPGLLVRDLFSGDGPYEAIAEDFVTSRCSGCAGPAGRDGIHHDAGYLCVTCWARVSGLR